jgi:hypothetical protein
MTARQIVNVDALKAASAEFTTMRHLAMRFRGLLRGGTVEKLDVWLKDARRSGIYGMQRFARALRYDIEAYEMPCWNSGATAKPKVRSTGSTAERAQRVQDGFVPLMRELAESRGYYLLECGPDVGSAISMFDSPDEGLICAVHTHPFTIQA